MRIKITNKVRRLNSLKLWSAITGVALVVALVLTFLPVNVQISMDGLISINLSPTKANPSFAPRTETYAYGASLVDPYNITVAKQNGTVAGDILFCAIGWYKPSSPYYTIDSVPSGWVEIGLQTPNQRDRYALYYKIAGDGEPGSYTWSFEGSSKWRMVCSCYIGGDFDPDDPIDVVSNTAYRTADDICRAASMTVTNPNSPLLFFGMENIYEVTFTKPTTPTNTWVEDDDACDPTSDISIEICSMVWDGSGATGDMDATMTSGTARKHAFAVALNPLSVVAPTVTTQAATDVLSTSCTGNGNITATGGANATTRGFCYMVGQAGDPTTANSTAYDTASFGTGTYTKSITGLTPSTYYRVRAYAINSAGTGYGTTVQVTTPSACSPSISFNITSWNVNSGDFVTPGSDYVSGLTYFRITNNSGGAVTITISGTDMTGGGYTWDLDDDGSPGNMIYALKAGLSGGDYTIIVRETATYNTLVASLDDEATQDFGFKIWTPTVYSDGNIKSGNITLSVICD